MLMIFLRQILSGRVGVYSEIFRNLIAEGFFRQSSGGWTKL